MSGWAHETARTYFGNATALRDFRVQMRSGRTVLLFAVYLLVLIGTAWIAYGTADTSTSVSVVEAQGQLFGLYMAIISALAVLICLVTPALTATSIIVERQRKSLDLVFSAPVRPRYYLVGKVLSCYRFVWMLLILSLPVTSACIVLGGATWQDVLVAYFLLSVHGLVFTAIGLFASTQAQKPTSALFYAYFFTGLYALVSSGLATASWGISTSMSGPRQDVPFWIGMSPFTVSQVGSTFTTLAGVPVPNWAIAAVILLLLCKLVLLATATQLGHVFAPEVKSLRLHTLGAVSGLGGYLIGSLGSSTGVWGGSVSSGTTAGVAFWWMLALFLTPVMPLLSGFGYDLERRYWPDGAFRVRTMFAGTPSGALPYALTLVLLTAIVSNLVAWLSTGNLFEAEFWLYVIYLLTTVAFGWAAARWCCTFIGTLRNARAVAFALILAVFVLPTVAVLLFAAGTQSWSELAFSFSPISPATDPTYALPRLLSWSAFLAIVSVALLAHAGTRQSQPPAPIRPYGAFEV